MSTAVESQGVSGLEWSRYFNCSLSCSTVKYIESENPKYFTSSDFKGGYEGNVLIQLSYESNEVVLIEDVVTYDFNNFIGESGGSLGFFLGASAITLYDLISRLGHWIFSSNKQQ